MGYSDGKQHMKYWLFNGEWSLVIGIVRGSRRRYERGAAMVEFAIIVPVLLLLVFGIVEYGLAFKDKLSMDHAVQNGTSIGASLGNDLDVDLHILNSVNEGVSGLPGAGVDLVERVEIFEVDANGNQIGGNTNVYYLLGNNDGPAGPNCDWQPCPDASGGGYSGWSWSPTDRSVLVGDLDVIGVRVFYAHPWVTGGLVPLPDANCDTGIPPGGGTPSPSFNCWVEESAMRLEPLQFPVGGS